MPELHILIFQFVMSVISASIIPAQGELIMFALLASGKYTDWLLLTVACGGTFLGVSINWVLGRYLSKFQNEKWFPVKGAYIEKAKALFDKHGRAALLLAGIPLIGDPITIVAGALKVNFGFYLVTAGLSKCARYGLVFLIYMGIV
ncbi:YqaA family protein [Candidatus Avelusimicrobium gallicola]|uniref:VTT domain-containing protein n=1 Tax=Candidatus Avelusimicrobium gallicola TaxID=2562704 RepID=A0A1Y4DBZ9_9BACT|nr:VTT domain-containing protein [Elusimicrobium sp. An273]OUO56586.1 hypothetical protein B5F75_05175 [Elusimicrobium sp. An273]